jgi:hypothetical protein
MSDVWAHCDGMTSDHTDGLSAKYDTSGPGKFEGQHPMVRFIYDNDLFDRDSGDVESPQGWFAQAGRWVVMADSYGFVSGWRFASVVEATADFDSMDDQFSAWLADDDDEEG